MNANLTTSTAVRGLAWAVWLGAATILAAGCERKEKLLEIEHPGGRIEVERSKDSGEIEIETEKR
ncbi:MAG TPA: hypothetical protein VML55_13020 [Planctomycetaceae bacterium]|nr:hypothetical protein [Planctomycetaceae bacterium]